MSAVVVTDAGVRTGKSSERATLTDVVHSEWIKFRTLRSSWLILVVAAVAMVGLGLVVGYNVGKNFVGAAPEDTLPSGVLQGYLMAQLLIGVLGVLFVTGEYGTGMIRSTLAAVPRRVPVLLAKVIVFGAIVAASMLPAALAAFVSGQAFLSHYGHGTSLTAPGVLRVVLGTGVYLALVGLLGMAIGWIVRSTAGGIATVAGLLLVLPGLLGLLPGSIRDTIVRYMPSTAGESFIQSAHAAHTLQPWAGLAVMTLWVLGALVVGATLLRRRDA